MISAILAVVLSLNEQVTPQTIHTTVCVPGWAESVRPPTSWTSRLKRKLLPPGARMQDYVLDHVEPISLGGAPRSPANLRLQTVPEGHRKDREEKALSRAVCAGRKGLEAAQREMAERWPP